jgi:hypothetical protein
MHGDVFQYDLPAPREIVELMKGRFSPLAALASHPRDVIVGELRRELGFKNLPHLAHVTDAILELPLSCLSVHGDAYWLTFHGSGFPIHLTGRNEIPPWLYEAFPIGTVNGLEEFLRYFGGMVHGYLDAAAGIFWSPSHAFFVSPNDPNCAWGTVGEWQGALSFYGGASGDQIVIHRDGSPGKWLHEFGGYSFTEIREYGLENPFAKLPYSFTDLIDHFADYLSWPREDPRNRDSPFYY